MLKKSFTASRFISSAWWSSVSLALILLLSASEGQALEVSSTFPAGLPTATDWKDHLVNDLIKFWVPPQTLGEKGNFPTYRCNDGQLFDKNHPCQELAKPAPGIVWLNREYLRMKSRQVYGYGVAYHVTGEKKYLEFAKEGVDFLMKNGFQDLGNGKFAPYTFWEIGQQGKLVGGPSLEQRTSQDMAYSLTGIGFYYYLTHDPEVLKRIIAVKNYIFDTYYDEGQQIIHWVNQNFHEETTDKWELTAQLDQIYGYMIWLTPSLPPQERESWKKDMLKLAYVMKDHFYPYDCTATDLVAISKEATTIGSPTYGCGLFWGDQTQGHAHAVGKDHNDYGHSVKAMWMIYTIAKMVGDKDLAEWSHDHASKIIERAYDNKNGSWNRDPTSDDKEWWSLCELDQTAGTFAMTELKYAENLPKTWDYWKNHMVDKINGEVWHLVKADGTTDKTLPKQHSWKNMMHSTEHALVGYITSSQIYDYYKKENKGVELYYAFATKQDDKMVHPYVYEGTIKGNPEEKVDGQLKLQKYTFTHIKSISP